MLTHEDLQAIGALITTAVTASEQRMSVQIESAIGASEQRMSAQMAGTRTDIMSYIESHVETQIHKIADGHLMLAEKMDRMEHKIDAIQDDVSLIKGELVAQDYINAETRNAINLFTSKQPHTAETVQEKIEPLER